MQIEGTDTKMYLGHMFTLIPEKIRPERRKSWKVYDGARAFFIVFLGVGWYVRAVFGCFV